MSDEQREQRIEAVDALFEAAVDALLADSVVPLESVYCRVEGARLAFWCPGCEDEHVIGVGSGGWTWDGDMERPTVSPSIKVTAVQWFPGDHFYRPTHDVEPRGQTICHSFLRAGVWEFLDDCTHGMKGQHVPMVPMPPDREEPR